MRQHMNCTFVFYEETRKINFTNRIFHEE